MLWSICSQGLRRLRRLLLLLRTGRCLFYGFAFYESSALILRPKNGTSPPLRARAAFGGSCYCWEQVDCFLWASPFMRALPSPPKNGTSLPLRARAAFGGSCYCREQVDAFSMASLFIFGGSSPPRSRLPARSVFNVCHWQTTPLARETESLWTLQSLRAKFYTFLFIHPA